MRPWGSGGLGQPGAACGAPWGPLGSGRRSTPWQPAAACGSLFRPGAPPWGSLGLRGSNHTAAGCGSLWRAVRRLETWPPSKDALQVARLGLLEARLQGWRLLEARGDRLEAAGWCDRLECFTSHTLELRELGGFLNIYIYIYICGALHPMLQVLNPINRLPNLRNLGNE